MKTRLYLDCRHLSADGTAPLKFGISRNQQTAYISLGLRLLPSMWNEQERRLMQLPTSKFPQRMQYQSFINRRTAQIETLLLDLEAQGRLHLLSAVQIRDLLLAELEPKQEQPVMLSSTMRSLADTKLNADTKARYLCTLGKVLDYCGDIEMQDITAQWLTDFNRHLLDAGLTQNSASLYLRNIRSAFYYAMDNGLNAPNPFRKFKIRFTETEKRSLSLAQMRDLAHLELTGRQAEYRDMFLLSFSLLGINFADMLQLLPSDYKNGRITYRRNKTGRLYDVKVQDYARVLIDRYRGTRHLLSPLDRFASHRDYNKWCNTFLHSVLPELTTYWARHTWATLAYNELGTPTDVISLALGHSSGSRVTAVYINPDLAKVDEANRRLLDLIMR